ncbi:unnamed protein product [Acanthosepion pharaonis]|uniref:Uncharacterized protein n=1 Tax=Acanthosepion pharaonis TaxID=158019 RepID=A0A812AXE6_ACAPH|nr:unnamed protein product [Sepia pharaonis]
MFPLFFLSLLSKVFSHTYFFLHFLIRVLFLSSLFKPSHTTTISLFLSFFTIQTLSHNNIFLSFFLSFILSFFLSSAFHILTYFFFHYSFPLIRMLFLSFFTIETRSHDDNIFLFFLFLSFFLSFLFFPRHFSSLTSRQYLSFFTIQALSHTTAISFFSSFFLHNSSSLTLSQYISIFLSFFLSIFLSIFLSHPSNTFLILL